MSGSVDLVMDLAQRYWGRASEGKRRCNFEEQCYLSGDSGGAVEVLEEMGNLMKLIALCQAVWAQVSTDIRTRKRQVHDSTWHCFLVCSWWTDRK
jgi:hypothetical protein